jgi:ABC-type Mn2+/Zn2+ transport system permease subunit
MRQEILLGLALPPAGSAAIALAVALGAGEENRALLFAVTVAALLALVLALPLGAGNMGAGGQRRREIILAGALVLGNALTLGIMALSPRAESHLRHLLSGEVMAAGKPELTAMVLLGAGLLFLGIRYRGALFALSLDEEMLRAQGRHYAAVRFGYRAALVSIVTAALMLAGPVLCAALLILPPLFAEGRFRGLERNMAACSGIGAAGVLAGFLAAIAADLPPAPCAAAGMAVVGLGLRLFIR